MPIINETFSQPKINRLKSFLLRAAEKGNAKYYEIFVDSLKVIEKTNDHEEFEVYEDFVNADTKEISVLIYNTPNSPRNDKYNFSLIEPKKEEEKDKEEEKGLSGAEVQKIVSDSMEQQRKDDLIKSLQKEKEALEKQVGEAESYIGQLQDLLEKEKDNKYKLGKINVGELASVALEGFVRRNTKMLAAVPGAEALAGIIEADNNEREKAAKEAPKEEESEVSFKKKGGETALSEEEKECYEVLKFLQNHFSKIEMRQAGHILNTLAADKSLIAEVLTTLENIAKKIEKAKAEVKSEKAEKAENPVSTGESSEKFNLEIEDEDEEIQL